MTDLGPVIRSTLAAYAEQAPAFELPPHVAPSYRLQRWVPALAAAAVVAVVTLVVGLHALQGGSTPPADGGVASPSPTPTTSQSSGAQPCTTATLDIQYGPTEGVAGTAYHSLDATNTGTAPCRLDGLPQVTLSGGDLTGQLPVSQHTLEALTGVLLPDQKVTFAVAVPNPDSWQPPAPCRPATPTALLVTFGSGPTASLPWTDTVCSGDQGTPSLLMVADSHTPGP